MSDSSKSDKSMEQMDIDEHKSQDLKKINDRNKFHMQIPISRKTTYTKI